VVGGGFWGGVGFMVVNHSPPLLDSKCCYGCRWDGASDLPSTVSHLLLQHHSCSEHLVSLWLG
jgi:hypothetical protein